MAKLTRKLQKIFAGTATNNGQFGSAKTGTKVTSTDLDTLQALSAFSTGWNDAVISSRNLPPLEEVQALDHIETRQLAYLFQEGIPEYDVGTTYYANSIVKKTGTYELYGSLIDDNIGNALPNKVDDTNWKYLVDLSSVGDPTLKIDQFSGFVEYTANKPYTVVLRAVYAGSIVNTSTKCVSGTCTATFKINGTSLGGTANSVSSTLQTQAHTTSNTFAIGDVITMVISSSASCYDMAFTVKTLRA